MSSTGVYRCCDDLRRELVKAHAAMNGIKQLDVVDPVTLHVSFAQSPAPSLKTGDVTVESETLSAPVKVTSASIVSDVLVVTLDQTGDASPYVFRITKPDVVDPQRAFVKFSFGVQSTAGPIALNGIDYLEVIDPLTLHVFFVNTPAPSGLDARNVVIEGGERIRHIEVLTASVASDVLTVTVKATGDFSPYTLTLTEKGKPDVPLATLDPRLASIDFGFRAGCDSDFDCRVVETCPPRSETAPHIDYLAKDYASFRRLMLDRLSLLLPGWRERTPADLGVTLVELLAYVADHLSYQQDAIATEAYLGTARRRTSMRRHARLVDYVMHDGANARVFVELSVNGQLDIMKGTQLLTRVDGLKSVRIDDPIVLNAALAKSPLVFETMQERVTCHPDLNQMSFHTWGSRECCLPRGATSATLAGAFPALEAGRYLVFREITDPDTGASANANPEHRHAVRLTRAAVGKDLLFDADITDIEWEAEDALPFPLCISATTNRRNGSKPLVDVSVAYGNVVLSDHGLSVSEDLGEVPEATQFRAAIDDQTPCRRAEPVAVIPRFRPTLMHGPLTQHAPFDPAAPASKQITSTPDLYAVLGAVSLGGTLDTTTHDWAVRRDLLESDPLDRHFVAEVEDDGIATLRFGDDEYGERPVEKTGFTAFYRIGSGPAGNIGADAIAHIVTTDHGIDFVTNSIPARGGTAPETIDHAKQSAPAAFRMQQRAVTENDYAEVTQRRSDIDRAAATFRWTGSWYTVFDTIDRHGGLVVDDPFRDGIRRYLEQFRVVGRDVEVDPPRFVPLEIALMICVKRGYFRSDVEAALRNVFMRFFDPDNFTFGQPVALSRVIAAAASVDGVDEVVVDAFQRQGMPQTEGITSGFIPMGRLEIAQLDNDRAYPERGSITLVMRGGA